MNKNGAKDLIGTLVLVVEGASRKIRGKRRWSVSLARILGVIPAGVIVRRLSDPARAVRGTNTVTFSVTPAVVNTVQARELRLPSKVVRAPGTRVVTFKL